jgi:hypothetical protein
MIVQSNGGLKLRDSIFNHGIQHLTTKNTTLAPAASAGENTKKNKKYEEQEEPFLISAHLRLSAVDW